MFAQKTSLQRVAVAQQQLRAFSTAEKVQKMEMTMRTPYKTLFEGFSSFENIFVHGVAGRIGIVNQTPSQIHLIPAGEIHVTDMSEGAGKKTTSQSGKFIHTGGWVFVHP